MNSATNNAVAGSRKVAVIGSGVAGLTAAWVLSKDAQVCLYEADSRLGGHADTHRVEISPGVHIPVDTGFIVHNDRTYPTLLRLFSELGVATQESDMSMSVRSDANGLEYAGAKGISGIFATPRSLMRGQYLKMLTEVLRFHRLAKTELSRASEENTSRTLAQFLDDGKFSEYFIAHFMTPLVSAVWSCSSATALAYPSHYLFTFLDHHGMLTVTGSPTWRTVTGGSIEYVNRISNCINTIRLNAPVRSLSEHSQGIDIRDGNDDLHTYDAAVIATHPHQALSLLARPTDLQRSVLGSIHYAKNEAILHTDESLLPRNPRARASWNYRLPLTPTDPVEVTYDMTRLQRITEVKDRRFLVTLGAGESINPSTIIEKMSYEHPQYTPESLAAQKNLGQINSSRLSFAGAYHGWGFHEDGCLSGLRAAEHLGGSWSQ
ncbi:MAG: NAD(P)/FAD-dependent oxidoreductase [Mycobacteriaceae bacterium]